MGLGRLLILPAAAAAAFVGAKRLLAPDAPERIDRLPQAARAPLLATRGRLERLRERGREVLREARTAREEAERELMAEYKRRAGR